MGYPAEFREGVTHCSDCGSLLAQEVLKKEDIQKTPPKITLTDLHKRILYTIGFVLLWRVLILIPAPGIDLQALQGLFGHDGFFQGIFAYGSARERLSVVALGVTPYLTAYMIVEILSLFIPPLKSWRGEGYAGRIRIKEIALFATFLIALLQSYGIAVSLEDMMGSTGEKIIGHPGLSFRLISALTLTAGTFIMIWIAELITRKGIGQGISILILTELARGFLSYIPRICSLFEAGSVSFVSLLLYIPMIIIIVTVILFMERSKREISVRFNDDTEAYIPLKLTSAGTTPVEWASMLIMLPTTVFLFTKNMHFQWLMGALTRTGFWYFIIDAILIIFLYYLFTSFFYDSKRMSTFLKNRRATLFLHQAKKMNIILIKALSPLFLLGLST